MKRADFLATLDIGMTIKKLREMKGLSQEQLAKDICDRTNITKLENGHSKVPSLSFVLSICERLEITIDEFLNYALTNNYKLNRKLILEYLVNDDKGNLTLYLDNINPDYLSKKDYRYYNFLKAKTYLDHNHPKLAQSLLISLIKNDDKDFIYVLSTHLLLKHNLIKENHLNKELFSRSFLNALKDKNTPNEYLYFINDMLTNAIENKEASLSKYLLELEISFINSHDLYKYLSNYYHNKIQIYRDEYNSIQDIESKLLPIKNKKVI